MQKSSGAERLVEGLSRWGVDKVFGLPGVHLDPFFDALHKAGDRFRVIHTRHEQGAAYMAFGAAMATGRPSAFAVVPGPGVLNAASALATAYACNAPVLCITSTVVWPLLDRGFGALHEVPDQTGVLQRLTKWTGRANDAGEIPALVDEAFRQLLSGRPRPVAIEIPPEILAQRKATPNYPRLPTVMRPPVDDDQVNNAVALIEKAQAPMIVVGGGAQGAANEVVALAEAIGAPVVTRQMGRGVISDDHPLAIQAAPANSLWKDADLVIGIGTRLQQLREWGCDEALSVVRIDIDAKEHDRIARPTVGLVCDAADGAGAIARAMKGKRAPAKPSFDLDRARNDHVRKLAEEIPLQTAYMNAIRGAAPRDAIIVDEITQVGHAAKLTPSFFEPRTLITSGYQGTLGYGYATAIGAAAASPGRTVISINGDGGFMYTMPELATAVLHDIPLIAIVFNDSAYGNVKTIQERWYENRVIATDLHNPDFAALGEIFGAVGMKAESPEALEATLAEAIPLKKPVIIEVPVEAGAMGWVWSFIIPQKVRGAESGGK